MPLICHLRWGLKSLSDLATKWRSPGKFTGFILAELWRQSPDRSEFYREMGKKMRGIIMCKSRVILIKGSQRMGTVVGNEIRGIKRIFKISK